MVQLQAVVSLPVLERLPAVLRVLASQNPAAITSAALPPSTTVQVPVEEELPTTMVQLQAVADHFPSPQTLLHRSRFPPRHSPLRIHLRTVRPRTRIVVCLIMQVIRSPDILRARGVSPTTLLLHPVRMVIMSKHLSP